MARQSIKTDNDGRLAKLGAAIRAVRLERGLSQEALADAAGIAAPSLASRPSLSVLIDCRATLFQLRLAH